MRCVARQSQKGLTLVECAAALALAALTISATSRTNQAAATLLQRTRSAADTLDVARNLLEHELGAPCGAAFECPPSLRCSIARTVVSASIDRVTATVHRDDGAPEGSIDLLPAW